MCKAVEKGLTVAVKSVSDELFCDLLLELKENGFTERASHLEIGRVLMEFFYNDSPKSKEMLRAIGDRLAVICFEFGEPDGNGKKTLKYEDLGQISMNIKKQCRSKR